MKITIEYNPSPEEQRKAILKTYTSAVRTKYALLAEHELTVGRAALEKRIAEIQVNGGELNVELGTVFAKYGPDALAEIESGDPE